MWTDTSANTSLHETKMVEFQWNKFKEYIVFCCWSLLIKCNNADYHQTLLAVFCSGSADGPVLLDCGFTLRIYITVWFVWKRQPYS